MNGDQAERMQTEMALSGRSTREIAALVNLSPRRVNQIRQVMGG